WALNDIQGANTAFQEAVNAEPENAMLRVRWGELYYRTYQYGEAYNLFSEALEMEPENVWAHFGAARALAQSADQDNVDAHMQKVLENALAPAGAQLRGMIMMLRSALEQDRFADARELLAEAKEVAEDGDLPQMELKALEAAL